MLSYSSLVNRGKVSLPSVDSWGTNNNIQRDPPKSIMTRRIDKVSDNNDIVKMIDSSDRSTEAILRFSRGVNPSVSVSYTNHGGSLQNYGNQQSFLPYRINKDNDFHPPVQAPLDLLPLSRLPYDNVEVFTKPSMPHFTKELDNSRNQTATNTVKQKIISASVVVPRTYMLQKPFQEAFEIMSKNSINDASITVSGHSGKIAYSDRTVQNSDVVPSKTIVADHLQVSAETNKNDSKKKKYWDDVDFSQIKTNDVKLIEYTTALKGNEKTEMTHENFEFERNIPEYEVYSNIKMASEKFNTNIHKDLELERNIPEYDLYSSKKGGSMKIKMMHENDIKLDRNLPEYQLFSNTKSQNSKIAFVHDDLILDRNLPEYNSFSNISGNEKIAFIHNDISLERNIPEHTSFSNTSSSNNNKIAFLHDDLVLERNVPEHMSFSNTSGNQKVDYIHGDIALDRVLPEHEATTNISQNMRKTLLHTSMKEYERKGIISQMSTNDSKMGDETQKNSSRDYNHLPEKIQPGEFVNPGFVPLVDRTQPMNVKMDGRKSNLAKESFHLNQLKMS